MSLPERAISRREIVSSGLCIGCGACAGRGEMGWDRSGHLKPGGTHDWLGRRDTTLTRTCPFSPAARDEDAIAAERFPFAPYRDPRIGRFEAAYVGHAAEGGFRANGSSGGMVTWVAAELLRTGLVDGVAHVVATKPVAEGRLFAYRVSRNEAALRQGAKSRYYPIELSAVLAEIRSVPGRYAIVGVPCFIKAVHLLCAEDLELRDRIAFTLGLFCGHMKSAFMAESFAWQMGVRIEDVAAIDYRLKDPSRPANWYRAELSLRDGSRRAKDWWHLADGDWGAGFFQNSACDACDDVTAETADISFGDAWVEPYSSDGRGTNVVVARSPLLNDILRDGIATGRIELTPVDASFVATTQAAGLRQRGEGLAFRLATRRTGLPVRKRVAPDMRMLGAQRRLIYGMRRWIGASSHRMLRLARRLHYPALYIAWARAVLWAYRGLTYSHGGLGRLMRWFERRRMLG